MKAYNLHNYIGGKPLDAPDKREVHDKYSGELLGTVPLATGEQAGEAIETAVKIFEETRKYSAEKRVEILRIFHDVIREHAEEFTRLIVTEAGKPVSYARNEVRRALDNLETGIRETYRFAGEIIPMDYLNGKGKTAYTLRVPYGPVLGISPFNFPINLALHKIIPAIATGAPVIIKPAPQTPLSMLRLAQLVHEAGIPAGVFQVLMTSNETAEQMVRHPSVQILSFTGSDKVGWHLKKISPARKVFLEMGGNAAAVIDTTADLKRAARKLAYGSFLYAGQICISVQRIYVTKENFEMFIRLFLEETARLQSGNPADENTVNGPLISGKEIYRIDAWVKEAVADGAQVLTGGKIADEKHHIYEPTVLTATDFPMKVIADEIFGPVVNINAVENIREAIEKINRSRYGLQHALYSDSLRNIRKFIDEVEAGGIMINEIPGFRIDGMPYGGTKDSGIGREGPRWAMEEYTEPKLVVIQ